MKTFLTRRGFLQTTATGTAALAWLGAARPHNVLAAGAAKPAVLGGTPTHSGGWPGWPSWRQEWEPKLLDILRSGCWWRGSAQHVDEFEKGYAEMLGAKRCLATASGTTALIVSLHVMDVDAGDEVIVSPWTFIATYNAVLEARALPVFADTDPATLTMDPASIESRITDRTKAIMPVHIYGIPCDMDPINAIAKKHNLGVIEDACQAWLAEYKGNKCGTLGDLGCFSFQNSKHLPSGEGGAVTSNKGELIDKAQSFHNCGRSYGTCKGNGYFTRGGNYRMQQFQAMLLMQQFEKLVKETEQRRKNADFLSAELAKIPGIKPVKLPENTRPVWHLYPIRYEPQGFNGLSRAKFIRALNAEGVPCGGGYEEQYFDGLLDEAINSRGYKRLFSPARLKAYRDSFQELKGNRQTCAGTVGWTQNLLLADRKDMEHIVEAIAKIQKHSAQLA